MKKFWKRHNKVASAVDRLTDQLGALEQIRQEGNRRLNELLTDPEQLASLFQRALGSMQAPAQAMPITQISAPVGERQALLPPPEAVKEAIDTVTKAMLNKMEEMEKHIATAVSELPPDVVQCIADRVKAGEEFKLRRRHGCIYIDFGYGDEDYWLRL